MTTTTTIPFPFTESLSVERDSPYTICSATKTFTHWRTNYTSTMDAAFRPPPPKERWITNLLPSLSIFHLTAYSPRPLSSSGATSVAHYILHSPHLRPVTTTNLVLTELDICIAHNAQCSTIQYNATAILRRCRFNVEKRPLRSLGSGGST